MKEEVTAREAKQGVQVKGMRHVLVIGIAGTALAFLVFGVLVGYFYP
jgi:hypothetical protein